MKHEIISRVEERVEHAKGDSDFTYFWSLLLLGETVFKTTTLGVLAALTDDRDRNRYRLEHSLVKADGLGDWAKVLEDALTGPAAQFLFVNAYPERNDLTKICNPGDWQYDAVLAMKQTLVEVGGMEDDEASELIAQTAQGLGISGLISPAYVTELIQVSEGHPYVMKILLGEVARERKAGHIPRLVANRDEILLALFERTYASMPPCAQRVFMTLASWNSAVARISLEAVLHRTIPDRAEVERSIDLLVQYSLSEKTTTVEGQEFLGLPLVASVFGKRKLNVCPIQAAIKTDVELLQMFGPAHRGDVHATLLKRIETFLGNVSHKLEKREPFSRFEPIVEMICRNYNPGWLAVARWYMEEGSPDSFTKAKAVLRRFLEVDSTSDEASDAWRSLAVCCFKTNDTMGEIHAFIERSKIASVPFDHLSNTANRLNNLLRAHAIDVGVDEKRILASELYRPLNGVGVRPPQTTIPA